MPEFSQDVRQRLLGTPEQDASRIVRDPPNGWRPVVIEDYDPAWADRYEIAAAALLGALGDRALGLEHVGSTSVPGLAAKPIVDIDLTLADTDDESRYIPILEKLGYVLILREPWWHGHRMLIDAGEDVHLHVWPQGAPEITRHLLLRDWLRTHAEDRELYASTKRRLAREAGDDDYTMAKNDVIDAIFERIFAAHVVDK
ncbi:GrpB family protein [Jidongwangia harbinensis]|uniref:GrpB family protein n=1 Tax=Jidongwangia harbinensis TaxID=2878561 RepID=UPI001CD95A45|nr:GrpB family protein [Jidongwangia harbinensis]MCA2216037.1 GrpB family protein [Jidongwangia harbinensis]